MVPSFATAPILIMVGAMMFKSILTLKLQELEDLLPAFLTLVLIPLTFSITQGILWGLLSHVVLYTLVGRRKELSPMMIGIGTLAAILLAVQGSH